MFHFQFSYSSSSASQTLSLIPCAARASQGRRKMLTRLVSRQQSTLLIMNLIWTGRQSINIDTYISGIFVNAKSNLSHILITQKKLCLCVFYKSIKLWKDKSCTKPLNRYVLLENTSERHIFRKHILFQTLHLWQYNLTSSIFCNTEPSQKQFKLYKKGTPSNKRFSLTSK